MKLYTYYDINGNRLGSSTDTQPTDGEMIRRTMRISECMSVSDIRDGVYHNERW